jgi:hypothetical protein
MINLRQSRNLAAGPRFGLFSLLILLVSACGTVGLIAWSDRPTDEGEIRRQNADTIMCQTYGENWTDVYFACRTTNLAQYKEMLLTYKSAVQVRFAR